MHRQLTVALLVVSSAFMAGCAQVPETTGDTTGNVSAPGSTVPAPEISVVDRSTDRSRNLGKEELFIAQPLQGSDPMPRINIENVTISSSRVYELMRTLLDGKNISFSISGVNSKVMRRHVSASNITGDLEQILDDFANSVGFYWHYKGGTLHIAPDRQYIATIPPIDDVYESMPPMLQSMGAVEVFVDRTSHLVTYSANREASEKIEGYLKHIRDNKKMISYDVYVWQVELDGDHKNGIRWEKLDEEIASKRGAKRLITSSDAKLGAGFSSTFGRGELPIDVLTSFLSAQGKIHAISQPKMSMISGGKSTFRIGNTTVYAKQVGTDSSSGVTKTTVTTAQALSGIELTVIGNLDDGTVYTDIQMKLNDLLRFNSFSANGISLQLPQNANRELSTVARIHPGNSLLLAGINISRTDDSRTVKDAREKNSMTLPNSMYETEQRTELVLVFSPNVHSFNNEGVNSKTNADQQAYQNEK